MEKKISSAFGFYVLKITPALQGLKKKKKWHPFWQWMSQPPQVQMNAEWEEVWVSETVLADQSRLKSL